MTAKLRIVTWNARSISAKKIPLADFLIRQKINLALITETHLRPEVNFSMPNFHFLRLDRRNAGNRGGGVAIIIRSGINFTQMPHFNTSITDSDGNSGPLLA